MRDDFGALMSKARTSENMSLRGLRNATIDKKHKKGISLGLLSMIETGERQATFEVCLRIASVFSLDISQALSAAYRSRVNYYAIREKETLEAFVRQSKLSAKLDIEQ